MHENLFHYFFYLYNACLLLKRATIMLWEIFWNLLTIFTLFVVLVKKNFRQMHYCINWANSSYQFYQLFLNLKKNCLFGFVHVEKKLIVYVVSLCKLVCYVARWSTNLSSRISALAVSLHGLRRWRRCLAR